MSETDATADVVRYHDVWANTYDLSYARTAGLFHLVTREIIDAHRPIDLSAAVLDAGGGTGIWTVELMRRGHTDITLVDISPGMLAAARRNLEREAGSAVRFVVGDVRDLSFLPSEHFAFVLAEGDVLSYCGDSVRALSELARLAAPGAKVMACVESRLAVVEELWRRGHEEQAQNCALDGRSRRGNPQWSRQFPAQAFSPPELLELVQAAGLVPLSLHGKTILNVCLPVDEAAQPTYRWLRDFELANNQDAALLARAKHLEVVAVKPTLAKSLGGIR